MENEEDFVLDSLVSYRASALANLQSHWSQYFKDLNRSDPGSNWDIYKLGKVLEDGYQYELNNNYPNFMRHIQYFLDSPLVAHLCAGAVIDIRTSTETYSFKILKTGFAKLYSLASYGPIRLPNFGQVITPVGGISSMQSIKSWIEISLEGEDPQISSNVISASFEAPSYDGDFINLVAWLYADPRMAEMVPLWFRYWDYFNIDLKCERCGNALSHRVSVIKGSGPICGGHNYTLAQSDEKRILEIIKQTNRVRALSARSPLIAERLGTVGEGRGISNMEWLRMFEEIREVPESQLLSQIGYYRFTYK